MVFELVGDFVAATVFSAVVFVFVAAVTVVVVFVVIVGVIVAAVAVDVVVDVVGVHGVFGGGMLFRHYNPEEILLDANIFPLQPMVFLFT